MGTWSKSNTGKPVTTDLVRSSVGVIASRIDNVEKALDGTDNVSLDINGGTIDGTPIGLTTPDDGAFTDIIVDNINIDGNTISSTNTNGDIEITPNGNGNTVISSPKYTYSMPIGIVSSVNNAAVTSGVVYASRFRAKKSCTLTKLGIYLRTSTVGQKIKLAIYSDSSLSPNNKLAETPEHTIVAADVFCELFIDLSSELDIVEDTEYWIAVLTDTLCSCYVINADTGLTMSVYYNQTYVGGFSSTFPTPTGTLAPKSMMGYSG